MYLLVYTTEVHKNRGTQDRHDRWAHSMGTNAESKPRPLQKSEKRAFRRYQVCIKSVVQFGSLSGYACMIRDVCTGGMYLSVDDYDSESLLKSRNIQIEDAVKITCSINLNNNKKQNLVFNGDVVRKEENGFAIRFIDPDLASLLVLQEHAKNELTKQEKLRKEKQQTLKSKTFNGKTAEQLLTECNQLFESVLDPVMTSFMDRIVDNLFEASSQTKNTMELNTYYDALKIINQRKDYMCETFHDEAMKIVKNFSPVSQEPESDVDNYDIDTLAIVENDAFDDWLADTTTVDSIESRCRTVLNEIIKRLSIVYDTEIKKENNPYGPGIFTKAFHKATYALDMKHNINMVFYDVFKDILLFNLNEFYLNLNKLLKDNDVLPVINHKLSKPVIKDHQSNKPGALDTDTATGKSDKVSNKTTENAQATVSKHEDNTLNLYELVGELRTLQQQISALGGRPERSSENPENISGNIPGPETSPATAQQALQPYTPDEIVGVLSQLRQKKTGKEIDYKTAILTALEKSSASAGEKSIGVRENRIMDVAGNIFQSMIDDLQVSDKVRDWIKELELPVLSMALVDDTVFTNRNHIVRDVINKIAQLEVLAGETEQKNLPIIKRAIDWIIELVNTEFNGSTEVFSRAIHQLDILLKSQNETYSKNISNVVSTISNEEAQLKLNNKVEEVKNEITVNWEDISDSERDLWMKKAARLKDGDWLLFDSESDNPTRLRIAWYAPNTQRFVLVNLAGVKDRILHTEEMAKSLQDSSVTLIDNAREPAMDRAQYSMLQDLHAKLLFQNTHDQLTGLISRREFHNSIEKAIQETKHNKARHTVCFIDLDQFSVINSACGYEGGDKLLKEVAQLFTSKTGSYGTVSRISSDEFALILHDSSLDEAIEILEELLDEMSEYRFSWDTKRLTVTCSVGLVPISPRNTADASTLLQQAEASCRVAKDLGGNRIQVFSKEHEKLSKQSISMKWAAEIDRILEDESLYLRCQRIMPLDVEDELDHYEILLGVNSAEYGNISTPDFIEAAERHHRMPEVDRWVLKNAFSWITQNSDTVSHIDVFSINLSGLSLNDDSFRQFVLNEMADSQVPAEKICFEVTETAGVTSLSDASEFIKLIKETGCKFSLDDFGTGMSSYAYLKNMPVDYLKIDGTFVKDMLNNPCDFAVVKSICEIGQFMGKKIIAEYVENDEILESLRSIGINYGQGFGIEKPRLLKELT